MSEADDVKDRQRETGSVKETDRWRETDKWERHLASMNGSDTHGDCKVEIEVEVRPGCSRSIERQLRLRSMIRVKEGKFKLDFGNGVGFDKEVRAGKTELGGR